MGTNTVLGIIPLGSGNGLARHLNIPSQPEKALMIIQKNHPIIIDSATVNEKPFFCTAGIGFDAKVAADYAKARARGLLTYAKVVVNNWGRYHSEEYNIETEEGIIRTRALLITIGNANQWGNGFYITPHASLQDGMLDVAVVKPTPITSSIKILRQLRNQTITNNANVLIQRSSFVRIDYFSENQKAQFDGEVEEMGNRIICQCNPHSLHVISGKYAY